MYNEWLPETLAEILVKPILGRYTISAQYLPRFGSSSTT